MSLHENSSIARSRTSVNNDNAGDTEYELRTSTDPFFSRDGTVLHVNPVVILRNTTSARSNFISPETLKAGIESWLSSPDSTSPDARQRRESVRGAIDDVVHKQGPEQSSGGLIDPLNDFVKRNVIVPLSDISDASQEGVPSTMVLRGYAQSGLADLAWTFGGSEDPNVSQSIIRSCPSLKFAPIFPDVDGNEIHVESRLTAEGYYLRPATILGHFSMTGNSIQPRHRTHRDTPEYQSAFVKRFTDKVNQTIAESFIKDGQQMCDNDVYRHYDGTIYDSVGVNLQSEVADVEGIPNRLTFANYPSQWTGNLAGRAHRQLSAESVVPNDRPVGRLGLPEELSDNWWA
ncbi:hypothetical protein L198_02609 [Cryptococcus wingfieldii CBS 7118]|uniref:Uncharacterized protein n=1 Tax=Cryptococcus wingfieldii CBS 7118 TaxID=1295528 RepID=A0A1E3JM00_9TREE|nr:hypothetical protein L198_02609 [Cryptococcus wingfieldii CBS 7118]ODO01880.1 hypothetical protein L198_02609 [Cryptococcus wingfieldii CBS 7118]